MFDVWIYTLLSVLLVSVVSLVGIFIIIVSQRRLKSFLLFMVSFAAGALLGGVFIHLLPELVESGGFDLMTSMNILLGIMAFFVLEKIVHWRHCHLSATKCHTHPLAFMNLVGDGVHNFVDGVLIASSYMLSIPVGIATTVAVILHEIPQEMGDFGVLLHSGMKVKKALLFNFLSALTAFVGAGLVLWIGVSEETLLSFVIPIAIGGFLYIAVADLIPELHKDVKVSHSIIQLFSFVGGAGIMFVLTLL